MIKTEAYYGMTDKEKKKYLEERAEEIKWAIILVLVLIALVLLLR